MAILGLLRTLDPTVDNTSFAVLMALLGIGMGLIVSQLGNVVQSSVDASAEARPAGCSARAPSWDPRWALP